MLTFLTYVRLFFTFHLIHESYCWVQRLQQGYAYVKLKTFLERKKKLALNTMLGSKNSKERKL